MVGLPLTLLKAKAARMQEQFDKEVHTPAFKREFGQLAVSAVDGAGNELERGEASPRELKSAAMTLNLGAVDSTPASLSAAAQPPQASRGFVSDQADFSAGSVSGYVPEKAAKELVAERAMLGASSSPGAAFFVGSNLIYDAASDGRDLRGQSTGLRSEMIIDDSMEGSSLVSPPADAQVDVVWNAEDEAVARLDLSRWADQNQVVLESDEARQNKDAAPAIVFRLTPEQLANLVQAFPQLQPPSYFAGFRADQVASREALSAPDSAAKPSPARPDYLVRIRIQPAPK